MSAPVEVQLEDVRVIFMRADEDAVPAIQRAWAEFETAVGLKRRKFFGTYHDETKEYRVCATFRDDDDPQAFGYEVATLPGGKYLRARLKGEPPAIYEHIAPMFDELAKDAAIDRSRPWIEFYRSRDVIDLLLPIS